MRVLIPVDGSDNSLRTAGYVIRQAPYYREPLEIHLLNVQHPFPGTIRGVAEEAKRFHDEEGATALAGVRRSFDTAGLKYTHHVIVGDAAETIAHFVRSNHIDLVVMGYRGANAVANMLLGSVATKVLHLVEVPVLLVK